MVAIPSRLLARLERYRAFMWLRVRVMRPVMPAYMAILRLRTRRPVTFSEKIRYRIARDRRPMLTSFADKLEARRYVAGAVGPEYVPEVLSVASRTADLEWSGLPEEMAVKTNHGSGACVVIWNGADPAERVPDASVRNAWRTAAVKPSAADPERMAAFLDMNLKLNYYWMYGEWAYRDVRPRVFAEEYLAGEGGSAPDDYRFFVFDGKCELVLVVAGDPTGSRTGSFFRPDWTGLDAVPIHLRRASSRPERPRELPEMLQIANRIGRDCDFLRVDLILSGGRILVGELTNYPNAGRVGYRPADFDRWLGDFWTGAEGPGRLPPCGYPG